MTEAHHPHPIYIVESFGRFLYLLLIPVIRWTLLVLREGFSGWFQFTFVEFMVLATIVALGALRWFLVTYRCEGGAIQVSSGILVRRHTVIPADSISTLSGVSPVLLRPFRVVHLKADTPAGNFKQIDFSITVSRKEYRRILGQREGELRNGEQQGMEYRLYKPSPWAILLLSVFTSNSLGGILLIGTTISQMGEIAGNELSYRLYGAFDNITRTLAFGIPPVAAAIAYILFFGWLVAFIMNVFRHINFQVRRSENTLSIKSGVFTKREYSVDVGHISYVDYQQSLLARFFGIFSVFVYAIGYGKDKEDLSTIIPAAYRKNITTTVDMLLPEFHRVPRQLKPNNGAIFKFLVQPLWPCALVPLVTWLFVTLFPDWARIIALLGFMAAIPAYWFLAVRVADFFTSGVSRQGDVFTFRYSKGFYLHTVIIPKEKIAKVDFRQSILQRPEDRCDLIVHSYSESRRRHHCKNLNRAALIQMFELEAEA